MDGEKVVKILFEELALVMASLGVNYDTDGDGR